MRRSPEHNLQVAVAQYLRIALSPPVWWTALDHGAGLMSPASAGRLKARGGKQGIPDLLICVPRDGLTLVIAVELKSPIGRLGNAQVTTHLALRAAGVRCHVARSLDDVEAILAHHDVPLRARSLPFKPGTQPAISPRPQPLKGERGKIDHA